MSAASWWTTDWEARGPVSASVPPIRMGGPEGAALAAALPRMRDRTPLTSETATVRRSLMSFLLVCRPSPPGFQPGEILHRLVDGDHVGVLGLEGEQALLVRRFGAVPHRLADHHGPEPALNGIHRGGPDAPAGGAPGDDERIHAPRVEPGDEVGAEEGR